MWDKLKNNPRKYLPQLLMTSIASWGFLCIGNVRAWSSSGIPSLETTLYSPNNRPNWGNFFEMTDNDLSWISSLPPLCSVLSALAISYPLSRWGRKRTLIALAVPAIVGFLLMGFTVYVRHKSLLYLGRILTGLLVGAATPAAQIYISECASPDVRGVLGSFTASFLALGILMTYVIGAFVNWYVLAWICGCFPLVLLIGMMFLPETPSWLLSRSLEEHALASLQRLRGPQTDVEVEFERLKVNHAKNSMDHVEQPVGIEDFFRASVLKALGISMGIMFFQQFTGINAIIYYTVTIFRSAGSSIQPSFAAITVGIVQLIFTISSGLFVDRYGRRALLLASGLVVSVSLASMGTFFYLQRRWGEAEATASIGWLPLTSLMIFFAAYSSGFANVPFIIMGELFPSRYRSVLGPASSSFSLLCTFIVVRSFPAMKNRMGSDGAFWLFLSSTIVGLIFIYFLLPETKGKSLEEIERLFSGKSVSPERQAVSTITAEEGNTADAD